MKNRNKANIIQSHIIKYEHNTINLNTNSKPNRNINFDFEQTCPSFCTVYLVRVLQSGETSEMDVLSKYLGLFYLNYPLCWHQFLQQKGKEKRMYSTGVSSEDTIIQHYVNSKMYRPSTECGLKVWTSTHIQSVCEREILNRESGNLLLPKITNIFDLQLKIWKDIKPGHYDCFHDY